MSPGHNLRRTQSAVTPASRSSQYRNGKGEGEVWRLQLDGARCELFLHKTTRAPEAPLFGRRRLGANSSCLSRSQRWGSIEEAWADRETTKHAQSIRSANDAICSALLMHSEEYPPRKDFRRIFYKSLYSTIHACSVLSSYVCDHAASPEAVAILLLPHTSQCSLN